jgi:hypothetical protein
MRKTLLAFLFLPLFAFMASDWVTVKLDDRASIDFPSATGPKDLNGNTMWMHEISKDARCMAMIVDFGQMGLDSAALLEEMSRPESFEQFKAGVAGQIAGSSVISEKNTSINGHKVFEYLIDMGKKDTSALNRMYNQNYFIGAKMYSLSFFEKSHKPQAELRNKFFNSFKAK